jgi:hypothetical protein
MGVLGLLSTLAALVLLAFAPLAGAGGDPGLLLELDRGGFELRVSDLGSGEAGPRVPVAVGSPGQPTPEGSFPVYWVILNPAWHPGPLAHEAGAEAESPSLSTPMGVAKIPFAEAGTIALHGGGNPLLLGKPVSGGCVRTSDGDMLRVIAWLHLQGALGPAVRKPDGEIHRPFRRAARMVVR